MVDAGVEPPIINDHEHQDFFIAILKGGSAIPEIEPEELAECRNNYVLHGGPYLNGGKQRGRGARPSHLFDVVGVACRGPVTSALARTTRPRLTSDIASRAGAPPTLH